jgi:hypothetical protein
VSQKQEVLGVIEEYREYTLAAESGLGVVVEVSRHLIAVVPHGVLGPWYWVKVKAGLLPETWAAYLVRMVWA